MGVCEVWKLWALLARHNRLRDWSAGTWTAAFGVPADTEQAVPAWDRQVLDAETGDLRVDRAVLDVATPDSARRAPLCGLTSR